jgi:hypothetical protein
VARGCSPTRGIRTDVSSSRDWVPRLLRHRAWRLARRAGVAATLVLPLLGSTAPLTQAAAPPAPSSTAPPRRVSPTTRARPNPGRAAGGQLATLGLCRDIQARGCAGKVGHWLISERKVVGLSPTAFSAGAWYPTHRGRCLASDPCQTVHAFLAHTAFRRRSLSGMRRSCPCRSAETKMASRSSHAWLCRCQLRPRQSCLMLSNMARRSWTY